MQLLLPASQPKSPTVKGRDGALLVLMAALIFFLVATTKNGLFPGDLGFWLGGFLGFGPVPGWPGAGLRHDQ